MADFVNCSPLAERGERLGHSTGRLLEMAVKVKAGSEADCLLDAVGVGDGQGATIGHGRLMRSAGRAQIAGEI